MNFRFVPVQYHLLVVNCFTILGAWRPWACACRCCRAWVAQCRPAGPPHLALAAPPPAPCADSCFLSWTAANDGWFQRLFPGLAQQFGMDMEPAAAGKAGKAHGAAKAAVAASPAPSSRKGGA